MATVIVTAALTLLAWRQVPWGSLPAHLPMAPAQKDFTELEIASAHAFRSTLRALSIASLLTGLMVLAVLGFSPIGARLIDRFPQGMLVRAALAVVAISLLLVIVRLPFAIAMERISRQHGLSTSTWGSWTLDQAKSLGISTLLTFLAVAAFLLVARWQPRAWWAIAAVGAAAVTVAMSFLFPVLIEPVFNRFAPMPEGALRTDLLAMAARDGVPVSDVLVADASRRTTALNAYVSGFGATRRIVVYDTLLRDAPPAEVEMVVAHELGHAKEGDVLTGTLLAALAAALGVLLVALVAGNVVIVPTGIATLVALISILSVLQGPASNALSRQVEARADLHALETTRDPQTFAAMQRRLALTNRADVIAPRWAYLLFASHPSTRERIAVARWWADREGMQVPGPLVEHTR